MSVAAMAGVFLVGVASGVLSGMFGIGGAVLTTPGIRVLGATPQEAIGSTVPPILPGAISGTVRYSRAGLVNWRVGLVCGAAGTVLAIVGAWVSDLVNPHLLMVATAGIMLYTGISTLVRARRPEEGGAAAPVVDPEGPDAELEVELATHPDDPADLRAAASHRHPVVRLAAIGAGAGALAGLLGVGGGIVMMPAFTQILKIPMKVAVASSLVAVAVFSVPALVTHALLGHVNWTYALLLTAGAVPGAQLGSKITIGVTDRALRLGFGGFVVVVAVVYGTAELLSLSS
jgi:uncharacterized membrane protein YfcA